MARKKLVQPKPKTLKEAEKELKGKKTPKIGKSLGGYALRNAKGVKERRRK